MKNVLYHGRSINPLNMLMVGTHRQLKSNNAPVKAFKIPSQKMILMVKATDPMIIGTLFEKIA
ncbi:hypothetical protein JP09_002425 [Dehalogenimonas etheniformans]|uniref:Uncharacterized protein n=1 Tax=Dehalogenimonas etheniformans TaxID=1536648 RepID=A0A2P5P8X4_9CHLR|nr:hypothetical protein JP09_002425 [Dehalogenimonas etheniformans]